MKIMCLNRQKSSAPLRVKKSMEDYLIAKKIDFRPDDEARLVVDKDNWPDEHLHQLYEWANQKSNEKHSSPFRLRRECMMLFAKIP